LPNGKSALRHGAELAMMMQFGNDHIKIIPEHI
jgi:hypothetical protein